MLLRSTDRTFYATTKHTGGTVHEQARKTSLRTPLQVGRGSVVDDVVNSWLLLLLLLRGLRRLLKSGPAGVTEVTVAMEVRVFKRRPENRVWHPRKKSEGAKYLRVLDRGTCSGMYTCLCS